MKEPGVEYPCQWTYAIIGTDEALIKQAVAEIIKDKKYELSFSKKSKGGKYVSMTAIVSVSNEEERNRVYSLLGKNPAVKTVL